MKYRCIFFTLIMVTTVLFACGQPIISAKSIQEGVRLSPSQMIFLEVESGELTLVGGGSADVMRINGQLLDPQRVTFLVSPSNSQVDVTALVQKWPLGGFSSPPVVLTVQIPDGYKVHVKTSDAGVTIRDFRGDIQVSSISGDLLAENVTGTIALVSGRGNIAINNASGRLRILGEHGILTLQNVSGTIGSSTIMGTIRYLGRPMPGDEIHLEVDHGPVEISLPTDPDLDVEIRSTSGDLTCIARGVQTLGRTCMGTLGIGGATLSVRTVSGRISLRLSPLVP